MLLARFHHTLHPYLLDILAKLPETLNPQLYKSLLPSPGAPTHTSKPPQVRWAHCACELPPGRGPTALLPVPPSASLS